MKNNLLLYLNIFDNKNIIISNWTVGEHIDHICNVIMHINLKLRTSNPNINSEKFSLVKCYVLLFGIIPRGRGKSPSEVLPNDVIEREALIEKIDLTSKVMNDMNDLNSGFWITHPVFGVLKCKNSIKFMKIHTNHHSKIIADIVFSKIQ